MTGNLPRAARFDRLYRRDPDPWQVATSPYERAKYQATLDALPRPHYRLGIEAGCSIGALSARLAGRCDRLIGLDVSGVALRLARRHHGADPRLRFQQADLPRDWPGVAADLIVLSEVLYYLGPAEIVQLARRIARSAPHSDCVLVNYLGPIPDGLPGAEAAAAFIDAITGQTAVQSLDARPGNGYRIDIIRLGTPSPDHS
ncbi:class I SAM-dependent methyltransferase [Tistrella sp. BH-R2-4]|uniref:Class I SAM-dependent methyltransferase n=1 Tax=Tistrella arctica TaxID=3133430 RepID=A0ABU9YJU9_9PROT